MSCGFLRSADGTSDDPARTAAIWHSDSHSDCAGYVPSGSTSASAGTTISTTFSIARYASLTGISIRSDPKTLSIIGS